MAERIPRTWNLEVQSEDSLGTFAANDVRANLEAFSTATIKATVTMVLLNHISQRRPILLVLAPFLVLVCESLGFAPSERVIACHERTRTTCTATHTSMNVNKKNKNEIRKEGETRYRNNSYGLGTNEKAVEILNVAIIVFAVSFCFTGTE